MKFVKDHNHQLWTTNGARTLWLRVEEEDGDADMLDGLRFCFLQLRESELKDVRKLELSPLGKTYQRKQNTVITSLGTATSLLCWVTNDIVTWTALEKAS
jgi:hypothetical protein